MNTNHQLATAIENGDIATVTSVLSHQPQLVNAITWTPPPLHCAVLWNQLRVAETLLDHGADIEMRDPDRQTTPLRYAILYGKERLVSLLLQRGANAGPIEPQGTTALELAQAAAEGAYAKYDDLPSPECYAPIVALLEQHRSE